MGYTAVGYTVHYSRRLSESAVTNNPFPLPPTRVGSAHLDSFLGFSIRWWCLVPTVSTYLAEDPGDTKM